MSNLYNPDYLLHLCKKYGLAPSKKYGQNYLIDAEVIEVIISAADLKLSDTVVEVGPGFGVLTLPLAERVEKVVSFEIEKKLQPYWEDVQNKNPKLKAQIEIIWGNVLREFERFCHSDPPTGGEESLSGQQSTDRDPSPRRASGFRMTTPYKVVANLPYQITSPVVRLFLEAAHPPEKMILMVQKEVAERMCALPGQMSLLSVAVQYYAEAEIVAIVPRSAFWPSPRVDSAVIKIIPHEPRRVNAEQTSSFFAIVKAGFANRRKLLMKNLLPVVGKEQKKDIIKAFSDNGLTANTRAQELTIAQWLALVETVFPKARE